MSARFFYRSGAITLMLSAFLVLRYPWQFWWACPIGTLAFVVLYFVGSRFEARECR